MKFIDKSRIRVVKNELGDITITDSQGIEISMEQAAALLNIETDDIQVGMTIRVKPYGGNPIEGTVIGIDYEIGEVVIADQYGVEESYLLCDVL